MDMRFYCVKDRVEEDQFNVGWVPGDTNMCAIWVIISQGTIHQHIKNA
jgi:hypothetical protein